MMKKITSEETREVRLNQNAEDEKQEGCGAFMKLFCCSCTPGLNFKSMFMRKPSALAPLDGMRFMAVLWVLLIHTNMFTYKFYQCLSFNPEAAADDNLHWLWGIFDNGDLGVDIFFVLSGFLITFILSKEYNKYGDIDWSHFMKMRFLRLYPAYVAFLIQAFVLMCVTPESGL